MDIFSRFIALLIIVILTPLFLMISVISFIFQGLPIFYKQERVGHNFSKFKIFKFRTMVENSGELITEIDDNRITYFGSLLRKTKIDELPQLFNIINGDMRFIGPRPEVIKYFDKKSFSFLKNIKPGISDFSSILLRNEDKILLRVGGTNPYEKLLPIKIKLADYYSKKKSFLLDLKLVIVTIISIFFPDLSLKIINKIIIKGELRNVETFLKSYVY